MTKGKKKRLGAHYVVLHIKKIRITFYILCYPPFIKKKDGKKGISSLFFFFISLVQKIILNKIIFQKINKQTMQYAKEKAEK